ncbi:MAG TPA: BON domain-containing protein, partial [Fodinibius sp.]|nr:BON domain-containing protein [Fodinibius sp.]
VKGVKGVKDINNKITVNYVKEPTDSEIKENVINALKWDPRVDDLLIDVSVKDDKVTLDGSVGSAYEKELAANIANTSGVKSVDVSALEIKPWARDKMKRKEGIRDLTDVQKEDAILDAFEQDPRVSPFQIDVEVENGIATLSGTVDNLKAKKAAASDAQNTMGVWMVNRNVSVKNKIVVTPANELSDSTIKQNVSRAIVRDPYVEKGDVNITVNNGAITLTGNAESYFEKLQAGEVASTAAGVESITNNISVKNYEPFAFDRLLYDWDPIADDVDFMIVERSDVELKEEVASQIIWSPYIDIDGINISVNNGVVTLTGTVNGSFEYNEATEEAYEAGALKVKNKLTYKVG